MADQSPEGDVKKKSPIVKIIVLVVLLLIVLSATVFGTLFATGFFDEKPAVAASAALNAPSAAGDAQTGDAGAAADAAARRAASEPPRVTRKAPERTRFEFNYHEVEREFLANLTNSRKVMQVQIALMTRYDQRVFDNFRKHEHALRSVTLDVMRQTQEADMAQPDFRVRLAEQIREAINAKLEQFEDFGGIEEIFFTTFVIQ